MSRRRHREGRIEHRDSTSISNHREEIALAQQARILNETKLEGWTNCQSYRNRKPRKFVS